MCWSGWPWPRRWPPSLPECRTAGHQGRRRSAGVTPYGPGSGPQSATSPHGPGTPKTDRQMVGGVATPGLSPGRLLLSRPPSAGRSYSGPTWVVKAGREGIRGTPPDQPVLRTCCLHHARCRAGRAPRPHRARRCPASTRTRLRRRPSGARRGRARWPPTRRHPPSPRRPRCPGGAGQGRVSAMSSRVVWSFLRVLATCCSTVRGEMARAWAMSLLVAPVARRWATWVSRGESCSP